MLRWTRPFSRRALLTTALAAATITAAGAATYHRLAVTGTTGSGGALELLQSSAGGGALQGEVAASADTSFKYPFGLFGIYDGSSSTFGIGTVGFSATGYGVAGASESANASIFAFGEPGYPAIQATTMLSSNGAPAIYAAAASGANADAIDAVINSGGTYGGLTAINAYDGTNAGTLSAAVLGTSAGDSNGVVGIVLPGKSGGSLAQAGVYGQSTGVINGNGVSGTDSVNQGVADGAGVLGMSGSGVAVRGLSDTGNGLESQQTTQASPAPSVTTETGILAYAQNGAGLYAYSAQDPAIAGEFACNVSITSPTEMGQNCSGLFIQEDGTHGYPLLVYEPTSKQSCPDPKYPFFVNSAGDLLQCGTTTTAQVYQRNSNPASDAVLYAAKQTESTVEDFGSAELVNGSASVSLAQDFKETIDPSSPYMVFPMPHGDSHGLYLASRSQNGFVIRESQGGRSTMAFDYRIVARPYGRHLARLPHESQVLATLPIDRPAERNSYAQLIAQARTRNRGLLAGSERMSVPKFASIRRHRYAPPPIPPSFESALQRLTPAARR